MKHDHSVFVTLTYAPENLPCDGSLVPDDLQRFLKRLRKAVYPIKIRYYAVGEYGDQTWRPHYHLIVFGLSVADSTVIASSWALGHIQVGTVTYESCGYVAGYVTKKMTDKADERLKGKHPEFARMSLRPGIGADAMEEVEEILTTEEGSKLIASLGDVPVVLQHGNRKMPLGRYLRRKLRERMGIPEMGYQSPAIRQSIAEMRPVFKLRSAATPVAKSQVLSEITEGKRRGAETRYRIFNSKKGKTL